MKKIVYYAHHQWKYDTPIEQWELSLIEKKLSKYEVFNPSTQIIFSPYMTEDEIMVECLEKVKECDALVFSSLSGVVGRGVYLEVLQALNTGKEVYYLKQDKLIRIKYIKFKDVEEKFKSNRTFKVIKNFGIVEVL